LSRENRHDALRIKIAHEFFGPGAQTIAGFTFNKVFEHEEAVTIVTANLFRIKSHAKEHSQF